MNTNDKVEMVRIDLTDTQKQQVKLAIGKDADSIELNTQELEERIAPQRNQRLGRESDPAFAKALVLVHFR